MQVRDDQFRRSFDVYELLDGERLVDSWTTSGGHLTLTSQRLLHEPMRTPEDFLAAAMKVLGLGDAGELLKAGIKLVDRRTKWAIPLGDIAAVQPGPKGSFLTVTRTSGEVWGIEIFPGLYSPRWSPNNAVARDQAMVAIRAAIGTPTVAALPPTDDRSPDMAAVQRQAVTTGRPVVFSQEDGVVGYYSPDGLIHGNVGGYGGPAPVGAGRPANLVGRWVITRGLASTWPGEPAYLDLGPDGAVGGRLQMYGALAPLAVRDATWWWVQESSALVVDVRLPPVEEMVAELRFQIVVTTIDPNRILGSVDGEAYELVRAP